MKTTTTKPQPPPEPLINREVFPHIEFNVRYERYGFLKLFKRRIQLIHLRRRLLEPITAAPDLIIEYIPGHDGKLVGGALLFNRDEQLTIPEKEIRWWLDDRLKELQAGTAKYDQFHTDLATYRKQSLLTSLKDAHCADNRWHFYLQYMNGRHKEIFGKPIE